MSEVGPALGQIAALVVALAITVPFLARLLAHTYTSEKHWRVERLTYRALRLDPDADQHWRSYALSVLGLSLVGVLLLYAFGRLQQFLPLSLGMSALPSDGAWNTAVSFVTNTNWQWYSGEAALGHLMQASGLTVQNFLSAAVGMSVAGALARGLVRGQVGGRVTGSRDRTSSFLDQREGPRLDQRDAAPRVGNFWRDLVRTVVRVLLPLSVIAALLLVVMGVVQNLADPHTVTTLTGGSQAVTGGPVASQEAIKELGTNGGGFYNANSAHPFENPHR